MSPLQVIHLHVGAHKTASTHLQQRFMAGRDMLRAHGVVFDGPHQWRRPAQERPFPGPRNPLQTILRQRRGLKKFAPAAPVWLVSEENIAGLPRDMLRPGPLYHRLPDRVRHFDRLFPNATVRLFLSVRSYDDYFRSMYCELLRKFPLPPFPTFYDEATFARRSWLDVVAHVAKVLPEESITLWRYEELGDLEERIVDLLTDRRLPDDARLPTLKGRTRPSLSAQAVSELLAEPAPTRQEHRKRVNELMRQHPVKEPQDGFDPWTGDERDRLRDRYASDLDHIRTQFPGLNFLAADRPSHDQGQGEAR